MSVKINNSAGGSVTLDSTTTSNEALTLPTGGGTLIGTAPSTSGNILTSDGTDWTSATPAAGGADTSLSNLSATGEQMVCKAWVNFNGTGTVAIRDSYNVSSITDNGTGKYTVNFSNNMSNANYSVQWFGNAHPGTVSGSFNNHYAGGMGEITTSSFGVTSYNAAFSDSAIAMCQVFGD